MLKKYAILLAVLMYLLCACSNSAGADTTNTESEASSSSAPDEQAPPQKQDDLESLLLLLEERVTYNDLLDTLYDDFDGDGVYELIAEVEFDYNAEFWLITPEEASLLHTTYTIPELYVITAGDLKLPAARTTESSDGKPVQIWLIDDGKAQDISIHPQGLVDIVSDPAGEVCAVIRDRIELQDGGSSCFLPYYFYLQDGQFYEYGAVSISVDSLYALPNAAELVQEIIGENAGDQITDVLYRGNGLIHINYTLAADNTPRYFTLRWDGNVLEHEELSFNHLLTEVGVYQAYCSEDSGMVVFPDTTQADFPFENTFELPVFHSVAYLDDMEYFFLDDEMARSIANFLYLSNPRTLPPQGDYLLYRESNMAYVMEISVTATPDDGDIKHKEHVDQVTKLLFGDEVQPEHLDREGSWFWYDAEHEIYTPKPMGFNEYMPVVLSYEDRGDQMEAEVVYLTFFVNGDMPNIYYDPVGDNGLLGTHEEIEQYCLEEAPRYSITLGKRYDQTYFYQGHTYSPA